MKILELTEEEADLISSIRNYKKGYPNGEKELEWYIKNLLDDLLEIN